MMNNLVHKRILLGITGGIAAYKSAELVRRLREHGAEVRVVMTQSACEFITPLTMQALSDNPVHTGFLDLQCETAMGHIELARWADVIIVAPASANFIARLAHGMADDLLSTLCLAADAPLLIAPAMNQQMWLNPATVDNIGLLRKRGVLLLGPAAGLQACGETGPGRMLEAAELAKKVNTVFQTGSLSGTRILVTAGPTHEAIDPVRYIGNRSSGRMGFAIARAVLEAGAEVTLIAGPVSQTPPDRVHCIQVTSAARMHDAVMDAVGTMDIFIAAAAVADYRCVKVAPQKLKKTDASISLTLEKTADILAEVASLANPPFTVGFAAETEDLEKNARTKLRTKGLDMIAANLVGENLGFDREDNALILFWGTGNMTLERAPKDRLARQLVRIMADRFHEKHTN